MSDNLSDALQEEIASARKAFGHIEGRSDAECLSLRLRQLNRLVRERTAAANFYQRRARAFELGLKS